MGKQKSIDQGSSKPVECFALEPKKEGLPATIDDLVPYCFVVEAALKAYNAKITAIKKVSAMNSQVDATYRDAIEIARLLFRSYERLGNLVEDNTANPIDSGRAGGKAVRMDDSLPSVTKMAKELGVKRTRLEDAKSIARNPVFIETVIAEAKARGNHTLPSKTKLLKLIRATPFGNSRKPRVWRQKSKYVAIEESNKRLASRTVAEKCADAIVEATSYMRAVIELWQTIPKDEKDDLASALFDFQQYAQELLSRYSPEEERKGA